MISQSILGFLIFSLVVIGAVSIVVFAIHAMPLRQRLMSIAASVLFCLCIVAVSAVQDRMMQVRLDEQLIDTVPLSEAPPLVAFTTIALGGFRGIIADVLFLRSEAMKEREQYFEMVQLASWIVKLQPRFTGAIAFLSWNMAYNVSVTFSAHEDRWRWVQRGIELARDEGLRYNPNDPVLYQELGWIYQHKLGNILDDAHNYYKVQLARQIQDVTGQKYPIDWATFAAAPREITALDRDGKVIGGLQAQLGPDRWQELMRILDQYQLTLLQLEDGFRGDAIYPAGMRDELEKANVFTPLDTFMRARWMREAYRLEPDFIAGLIEKHGYLDFRLPEAHAIYWASKGLLFAEGGVNIKCQRMVFQSLKNAFEAGRLLYITRDGHPVLRPNPALAESVREAYLNTAETNENNRSIMSGYENFLKDAMVQLFVSGDREGAQRFHGYLREQFPNPLYNQPTTQFTLNLLGGDISGKSMKPNQSFIVSLLARYYEDLAIDDLESAATNQWLARQIYDKYMEGREAGARSTERVQLTPPDDPGLNRAVLRNVVPYLANPLVANLQQHLNLSDDALAKLLQEPEEREIPPQP